MKAFVFKYIQTFDMQTFVVKHKEKFVGIFKFSYFAYYTFNFTNRYR